MNENFRHLLEFLHHNRKAPSQRTLEVFVVFSTSSAQIEFQANSFIDLDAQRGPNLVFLNHPDNFEQLYHIGFKTDFDKMLFDKNTNSLTISNVSNKIGSYTAEITPIERPQQ